jgi:hypothetical protein
MELALLVRNVLFASLLTRTPVSSECDKKAYARSAPVVSTASSLSQESLGSVKRG